MTRIVINRSTCEGYGNCVIEAPDLFELDDDGLVVLKEHDGSDAVLAAARRAAYDCPTSSISLVDGGE